MLAQAWLKQAGFKETPVQRLMGPSSAVIGIK